MAAVAGGGTVAMFFVFGVVGAVDFRSRVTGLGPRCVSFLAPLLVIIAAVAGFLLIAPAAAALGWPLLIGLPLAGLAAIDGVLNLARIRELGERFELRRRFAAAREFFRRELKKSNPQLQDSWFPYLLAFGLGNDVDRWFRSFGGASPVVLGSSSSGSFGGGSATHSGSSSGWTGGGGAFGGAGASGSWAVAAGALAAGVSTPSSSGSGGGGGGGGGSSGGGGGGGW